VTLILFAITAAAKSAEPTAAQYVIAAVIGAVILLYIGYNIYSGILKQMATNAKNKRLIKNQVTQWTGREYRRSRRS
jgi:hypothetical protein